MADERRWGKVLDAADVDGTTFNVFQPFKPNKNLILRAVRSIILQWDDPTWTDWRFQVHGHNALTGGPGARILTSPTYKTKSGLFTLESGYKETFWMMNDITLRAGVWYHLVPRITGYAPTADNFLAWQKDWPDPVYRTNNTPNAFNVAQTSYAVRFITADL